MSVAGLAILHDPITAAFLVADAPPGSLGFAVWVAGALPGDVVWRGKRLRLDREGRIVKVKIELRMPIYEYKCESCGGSYEQIRRMAEADMTSNARLQIARSESQPVLFRDHQRYAGSGSMRVADAA